MKRAIWIIAGIALIAMGAWVGHVVVPKPELPLPRVATLRGPSMSLSELHGKVVLVNFWATSCEACVHEMPDLVHAYGKYSRRGYDTVAVAMEYDHPNLVADFTQRRQLPFTVALDTTGALAQRFGVRATPTSFILDRKGRILKRYEGEPDWQEFDALVEKSLNDPA